MARLGQGQVGIGVGWIGLARDEADEQKGLQGQGGFAALNVLPRGDFSKQAAMGHALVDHDASPWCFLVVTGECRTRFGDASV